MDGIIKAELYFTSNIDVEMRQLTDQERVFIEQLP